MHLELADEIGLSYPTVSGIEQSKYQVGRFSIVQCGKVVSIAMNIKVLSRDIEWCGILSGLPKPATSDWATYIDMVSVDHDYSSQNHILYRITDAGVLNAVYGTNERLYADVFTCITY